MVTMASGGVPESEDGWRRESEEVQNGASMSQWRHSKAFQIEVNGEGESGQCTSCPVL